MVMVFVSLFKNGNCSFAKSAHAFWTNGTKAQEFRGESVKDDRLGGHRSARSAADEDGEAARPIAWPDP